MTPEARGANDQENQITPEDLAQDVADDLERQGQLHERPRQAHAAEMAEIQLGGPISEQSVVEPSEMTLSRIPSLDTFQPTYQLATQYDLPPGYGETRVVLMVRDPYWLHAYWEIAHESLMEVERKVSPAGLQQSQKVLRVHDVTNLDFDGTNSWYSFDIHLNNDANNWYINVDRPNRSYCVDLGLKVSDGSFILLARSNIVNTPRDGMSEKFDEEWMTIEALERTVRPTLRMGPSSPEFAREWTESREFRELLMGSEAVSSISSPGLAFPERKRGFWLRADVEVIIHGATDPQASLTIQGVPVKLRPDGTFSVRFALPDGVQVVPIEAKSSDGTECRRITTTIERKTT